MKAALISRTHTHIQTYLIISHIIISLRGSPIVLDYIWLDLFFIYFKSVHGSLIGVPAMISEVRKLLKLSVCLSAFLITCMALGLTGCATHSSQHPEKSHTCFHMPLTPFSYTHCLFFYHCVLNESQPQCIIEDSWLNLASVIVCSNNSVTLLRCYSNIYFTHTSMSPHTM